MDVDTNAEPEGDMKEYLDVQARIGEKQIEAERLISKGENVSGLIQDILDLQRHAAKLAHRLSKGE